MIDSGLAKTQERRIHKEALKEKMPANHLQAFYFAIDKT